MLVNGMTMKATIGKIEYVEGVWVGLDNFPYTVADGMEILSEMIDKNDYSDHRCIVALDGDTMAGIIIFMEAPRQCVVETLSVGYDYRGNGIGTRLMEYVMSDNDYVTLSSLDESVDFYKKLGFSVVEQFEGCCSMKNENCIRHLIGKQ